MKTTIGWLSDTHVGYRQYGRADRAKDFAFAFSRTVDDMVQHKVNAIIHTGDLFQSNRPSPEDIITLQAIHDLLIGYKTHMYMVQGNHDFTDPPWPSLLRPSDRGGITLIDRIDRITVNDVVIKGYHSMSRDELVAHFTKDNLDGVDILCLHQLVKEFVGFAPPNSLSVDDVPDKFQLVAIGDIHVTDIRRRMSGNLIGYPGATEMNSTSESEQKYWIKLTFEDRVLQEPKKIPGWNRPVWRWDITTEDDLKNYLDNVDQELVKLKDRDKRLPIVVVSFPTHLDNVVTRVRAKLDNEKFVIVDKPRRSIETVKVETVDKPVDEMTVDDILRTMLPAEDPLFSIAEQLLNPDTDAKVALNTYVDKRMAEITASA